MNAFVLRTTSSIKTNKLVRVSTGSGYSQVRHFSPQVRHLCNHSACFYASIKIELNRILSINEYKIHNGEQMCIKRLIFEAPCLSVSTFYFIRVPSNYCCILYFELCIFSSTGSKDCRWREKYICLNMHICILTHSN